MERCENAELSSSSSSSSRSSSRGDCPTQKPSEGEKASSRIARKSETTARGVAIGCDQRSSDSRLAVKRAATCKASLSFSRSVPTVHAHCSKAGDRDGLTVARDRQGVNKALFMDRPCFSGNRTPQCARQPSRQVRCDFKEKVVDKTPFVECKHSCVIIDLREPREALAHSVFFVSVQSAAMVGHHPGRRCECSLVAVGADGVGVLSVLKLQATQGAETTYENNSDENVGGG